MNNSDNKIFDQLEFIYGAELADQLTHRLLTKLQGFRDHHPELVSSSPIDRVNEQDCILITYGDIVHTKNIPPLKTLTNFLNRFLPGSISTIHILPFYPYSSDDGFSVINYRHVNSKLGTWDDIAELSMNFRLMFDAVINHISKQSDWFQSFLRDEKPFDHYFTVISKGTDLSLVFRPRATPLLHEFSTSDGDKWVWTTFSADQIDLNYSNPDVLFDVIDIILFYVSQGAEFIRLDAVTYIWKEIGTDCINLPRTHRIVQLLRSILDIIAPHVSIITETNIPHKDNIAYFGDGSNEAQMVYNFALPLLTLHAFYKGDARTLTRWAKTLETPSEETTFFNFLASHDGIGILAGKDFISDDDLNMIVNRVKHLGGFISYKNNKDDSQSPYELNINYLDALANPINPEGDNKLIASRFLASQAVMLALRGVPGIYFHSLVGSQNWLEGVEQTGHHRSINRQKLDYKQLVLDLRDQTSLRYQIFSRYKDLLEVRKSCSAFHPNGGQIALDLHPAVFSILRTSRDDKIKVICLHNVTPNQQNITIDLDVLNITSSASLTDLISKHTFSLEGKQISINFLPYQVSWLKIDN